MPWDYKSRARWFRHLPSPNTFEIALLVVSAVLVIAIAVRLSIR